MIDRSQHPHRRAALGVDQRKQQPGRLVIAFRATGDVRKERPLVGRRRRAWRAVQKGIQGDAMGLHIARRALLILDRVPGIVAGFAGVAASAVSSLLAVGDSCRSDASAPFIHVQLDPHM